jgi:hypothetical protein
MVTGYRLTCTGFTVFGAPALNFPQTFYKSLPEAFKSWFDCNVGM